MDLYATPEKSSFVDSQSHLVETSSLSLSGNMSASGVAPPAALSLDTNAEEEEENDDDQVTSDLVSGLMMNTGKPPASRRMSHEATTALASGGSAMNTSAGQPKSGPATPKDIPNLADAPPPIKTLLETQFEWSFDIFALERLSHKRPLVWLGLSVLTHFNVPKSLGTDEVTIRNWLSLVESNYRANPYHNSTHAADVMQSTAYFLRKPRLKFLMDPLDEAICLIAAIVHDVDHPGKTSPFLCNSNHELAILYNDISVLENHHAALAFKLTLSHDRVNILKNLDRETYKEVRTSVIDMVLATDMTKHFEHLAKFMDVFTKSCSRDAGQPSSRDGSGSGENLLLQCIPESPDLSPLNTPENIVVVKRILIKCADVSNPTRPRKLCIEWGERITVEYCNQTDEERALGLPIVMPAFDRNTCSIPKCQIGFIDFFINSMFEAWDAFGDFGEIIDYLRANYAYWKEEQAKREEMMLERKLRKSMSTTCGEESLRGGSLGGGVAGAVGAASKSQRSFSNPPATTPDDRKKLIQVLKGNKALNSSLTQPPTSEST